MFEFKASIPSTEMLHCTGVALYCSLQGCIVLQGVGIALYCGVQYSVTVVYCNVWLCVVWYYTVLQWYFGFGGIVLCGTLFFCTKLYCSV